LVLKSPRLYNQAMLPFRCILVALAGSETDTGLLKYAAMLAAWCRDAEIRCVHVTASADARDRANLIGPLRERALAHLSGVASANHVSFEMLDGLLEFATTRRSDLILLGHRRNRSGRRSLARRLAMKAPCSVWMVPEGSSISLQRILAPIDYSRRSADALSVATQIAEAAGLDECYALHVHFNEAAATFDEYKEVIAEQEDRAFCLFVAPVDLHSIHVKPLFVESSSVPHAIKRVTAEHSSDLIVMGTRGRSRSAAILLGSETEQVIMETRIPILVVKHFGERMRLVEVLLDRRVRDRGGPRFT
jgi:nucleotide-binding universal stress UspA family protein